MEEAYVGLNSYDYQRVEIDRFGKRQPLTIPATRHYMLHVA